MPQLIYEKQYFSFFYCTKYDDNHNNSLQKVIKSNFSLSTAPRKGGDNHPLAQPPPPPLPPPALPVCFFSPLPSRLIWIWRQRGDKMNHKLQILINFQICRVGEIFRAGIFRNIPE